MAVLLKLRTEDPANWQRARAMLKAIDAVRIGDLERIVAPIGESGDGRQGRAVEWDDPEPWPEAVSGAAVLDSLKAKIEHYASLPEGGAEAVALWALYTWVFRAFAVSPYLMVTAPEREAGKTRVTEVVSWAWCGGRNRQAMHRPLRCIASSSATARPSCSTKRSTS